MIPVIENKSENPIAVYKPENKNNLPKERIDKSLTDPNANPDYDVVIIEKKEFNSPNKTESGAIATSLDKSDVTLQAKPALYIPEAEEKERGGGLKEFLRKTTRVFERRTKIQTTTEDNKLLVGAFAVSLK